MAFVEDECVYMTKFANNVLVVGIHGSEPVMASRETGRHTSYLTLVEIAVRNPQIVMTVTLLQVLLKLPHQCLHRAL